MSTVDVFSEWICRQGYRVIRSESSYWYEVIPSVFQAFPYGWLITPSQKELRHLMNREKALVLRYSAPVSAPKGMISYHVVLEPPYTLEMLRSQARNAVRRGLKNAQVEEISFRRLASEGWNLQHDTLERQNRLKSMTRAEWEKICLSADGLPGFKAWGAMVNGELASILITCQIDSTSYVPYAASHRKFLPLYVNNALFYQVSCNLLATEGVTDIFFSLHSLDAPESVNEFKFRMGLQVKTVRQCVEYHPALCPLVTSFSCKMMESLAVHFPQNAFFPKAYGMMSYYLNGKLPLDLQKWPDALAKQRSEILGIPVTKTGVSEE